MAIHPDPDTFLRSEHGVCWVLLEAGQVALEQCPKKGAIIGPEGAWFVPGGKIHRFETASEALERELAEEWPGVKLVLATALPVLEGSRIPPGPGGMFLIRPFNIHIAGKGPPDVSGDGVPVRWFPIAEALRSPVPQVRMMVAGAMGWG
jgi:ADP-ribose pyrophosphatase YjhB (NUDIX family)